MNKFKKALNNTCNARTALNNKGNSLIELVMVMMLLVLFGITIITMIYNGGEAQKSVVERKEAQVNARIAMSYINVRIRQSDAKDAIEVKQIPEMKTDAIVIKYNDMGDEYYKWIYFDDTGLHEFTGFSEDDIPTINTSDDVLREDGMSFVCKMDENNNSITSSISYSYGSKTETLETTIYLRSSY